MIRPPGLEEPSGCARTGEAFSCDFRRGLASPERRCGPLAHEGSDRRTARAPEIPDLSAAPRRGCSRLQDVNGDGFGDIAVGHALAGPGANSAGATYVVLGGSTFESPLDLATGLDGTNGFVLEGSSSGDRTGSSVANAGVRSRRAPPDPPCPLLAPTRSHRLAYRQRRPGLHPALIRVCRRGAWLRTSLHRRSASLVPRRTRRGSLPEGREPGRVRGHRGRRPRRRGQLGRSVRLVGPRELPRVVRSRSSRRGRWRPRFPRRRG